MPEVWELQMLLAKQSEHEVNKNIFFFYVVQTFTN